jgi:hypothetical protein
MEAGEIVRTINRKLKGWANYFRLGPVSRAYGQIDMYVLNRLYQWACRKHKGKSRAVRRNPYKFFYDQMELVKLSKIPRTLPWAKA